MRRRTDQDNTRINDCPSKPYDFSVVFVVFVKIYRNSQLFLLPCALSCELFSPSAFCFKAGSAKRRRRRQQQQQQQQQLQRQEQLLQQQLRLLLHRHRRRRRREDQGPTDVERRRR